jgi:hypothetical protein
MGDEGTALAIAEAGKITDSYASNPGNECGLSRLELGRHAADSNAVCCQLAGGFNAQIRNDFALAIANAFDIGDQQQLLRLERDGDSGSGIVANCIALAILLPLALVGFIALLSHAAPRLINLPHRAFWLSEGRREQTLATLLAFACVQGCLLTLFAAALHYVILQANTTAPPQLPGALFVSVLLGLVAAMVAWTIALYVRFRHVD